MTFFRGKEDSEWKNEEEKMRRKRKSGWGEGGGRGGGGGGLENSNERLGEKASLCSTLFSFYKDTVYTFFFKNV